MKTSLDEIFNSYEHGVCHRGLHDLTRPENSRASFEYAIKLGFPFECDINLTKDRRFVVNHDGDLLRVTGKEGNIKDLTVEEIQRDYKLFDGSPLISLEELIELWNYQVPLVLEIKVQDGQANEIIECVKPILSGLRDKSKIVLISFNSEVLWGLNDIDINVGRLYGRHELFPARVDYRKFDFVDIYVKFAKLPRFKRMRKQGCKVLTWTIIDEDTASIASTLADAMTFELINSSKPLEGQKENEFLMEHIKKHGIR